ncbi:carboxypeptidase-like regulatory domain-containing protein [Anaerolinea sp.]|uniref:carboxypeptidase-like regulatory domain-containing protein n=1 Tax=Anaerolinea sp. TaxID=1872519 RepID=UPI002ACE3145|nr:carboxypeptidase-like regulatory domain-containing protein [Anaerolinea sp.]
MKNKKINGILGLLAAGMAVLFLIQQITVQAQTQPKVSHNACVGNCVVDVFFLHSEQSDSVAEEVYHRWYDTYYTLTDCDNSWGSRFSFLLDVIGEIVGAPGAPTLQCWQGVLGVANSCERSCNEYFLKDAKYAPNVKVSLLSVEQGYAEVKVDNHSNTDELPERVPNAYSRTFRLQTYLRYGEGTPLLVNQQDMPSLSFPNWIARGGYSNCISAFGVEEQRCTLLSAFLIPNEITTAVEFGNGALYDLTAQVEDLSEANGSFSSDGYVRLLSDGDSLTIRQGDFAGVAWIKTHNKSKDTHSQKIIPWDARNGSVTITNHECNTVLSTCWIFGDRTEVDTYVFALHGPAEKMLQGYYQVEVVAEMEHDKNIADNRAVYDYDAVPESTQTGGEAGGDEGTTQPLKVSDLPIVDLPGAGIYDEQIPDGMPGVMYRLSVPAPLQKLTVIVIPQSAHAFQTFVRRGEIPVPDYPTINNDFDCWMQANPEFYDVCPYGSLPAGEVYLFVKGDAGSAYQVKIDWVLRSATPTLSAQATPTPQATPLLTQEALTLSEVEDNGQRATANAWNLQAPFTGQVTLYDTDYLSITLPQTGIYTFTLTPFSPNLQASLRLHRFEIGDIIYTARAPARGSPAVLTFGGLAGEQYYLSVYAGNLRNSDPAQTYQLALTRFTPDPDEPNDSRQQAVSWDVSAPYQGYLIRMLYDRDYLKVQFPQSGIYTLQAEDLEQTQRLTLSLRSLRGDTLLSARANTRGAPARLTFDASAGEEFLLVLSGEYTFGQPNPYRVSVAEMIPDPHEPNDERQQATFWDVSQGSIQGYMWDGIRGSADYYQIVAPPTRENSAVTFTLTNPSPEMTLNLSLINARGSTLKTVNSPKGQAVELSAALEAHKTYYLRVYSLNNKKSSAPYTLSASYTPEDSQTGAQAVRTIRATVRTLSSGLVPLPLPGVEIYARVDGKPEILLGKTNRLGSLASNLEVSAGQEITLRTVKPNMEFTPAQDVWVVDETSRGHRWTFYGSESPVVYSTPEATHTPAVSTMTPSPKPRETQTHTPRPSATPQPTFTPALPSATPMPEQGRITGYLWRLFPDSPPAGVGAGEVLLTINGVEQPVVRSMIDGSYTIPLPALQAGDVLRLSARGQEDRFEPEAYEWKAEEGVSEWFYEFYSYWGTITPPARDDQNKLSGRVTDAQGRGVPGVYIIVQMGKSDALQRLGPTDADGYYQGYVRLPSRIMVTVWVDPPGFVPSRQQFFHAYAPEDRTLNFFRAEGR